MEVMLDTEVGRALMKGETVAENQIPLTSKASDNELDNRIRERGKLVPRIQYSHIRLGQIG